MNFPWLLFIKRGVDVSNCQFICSKSTITMGGVRVNSACWLADLFQSGVSLVSVWSVTDSILLRHGDVRPVDGGASPRSSSSTQYYGVSCAHLSKTVKNRPWMHVEITSIWNLWMTKNRWKFAILSVFNKWFNRYIHSGPKWWKIVHQCPLKSRQCKTSEWPKNR